jgi:pilus assembly protein CpaF
VQKGVLWMPINDSHGAYTSTLSPLLAHVLEDARRQLCREDIGKLGARTPDANAIVAESAARAGVELSSFERDEILTHLEGDIHTFGILQPLIDDPKISDIIVAGFSKVSVQQGRRCLRTQIRFPDSRSYEAFVERLLHRAGTSYSTKQPIADGMVGALVRVHAVHKSLCDDGPYLTIRINRFTSVCLDDLEKAGLAPRLVFDYLRGIVGISRTIMIVGEVGTGKTTLARALAGTIPHDESVLVIEDTPEIRLDHPHVRYMTTREENLEGTGRVSPAQCIRAGMRMAMNRIIFGEIRDAEAAEAFVDVCASGHSGLSTIHGRNVVDAVTRLELFLARVQKNADRGLLGAQVATAVQVMVVVDVCKHTGARRIMEVRELGPVADGVLRQREIFAYRYQNNHPTWSVVSRVSAFRERLEQEPFKFKFSSLPETLELPIDISYREAALSLKR